MHWRSKRGIRILGHVHSTQEYSTRGTHTGGTIATVKFQPSNFASISQTLDPAARTMYQRARKLQENAVQSSDVIALMEEQLEAYLLAINSLSLLDTKCAWVVTQAPPNVIIDVDVSKITRYRLGASDVCETVSQATEAFKVYSRFNFQRRQTRF
jgi:hypothetical protein